jgi:predicted transcriptional regulator
MPLTVRLDAETEQCLADLQAETGQDRSALVRQLIRERLAATPEARVHQRAVGWASCAFSRHPAARKCGTLEAA